jgi:phage host-nuclease inhibitor protein Gam
MGDQPLMSRVHGGEASGFYRKASMNLYEIDSKYQEVLAQIEQYAEEHDGEITNEQAALLEAVSGERSAKIENCLKYFKNETAKAEMIDNEIEALKKRQKAHISHAKWMKDNLSAVVGAGTKLEYACGKISWRSSSSVEIIDSKVIPEPYLRIIPEQREPDKNLIKQTLKSGAGIPGVKLVESQNIQIK